MNINTLEIVNKIEGNKDSINYFLNNLSLTNEGNVWMLNGQKGIGKSLLAKLIAANLLKIAYNENQIDKIFHPDLVILSKNNDKKIISVEEIRNLKRLFLKTSYSESYRVAIIDSINDLNLHGHNALLKTIEEPPEGSFICIINHQNSYVPATVKSRCKLLNLKKLTDIETLKVIEKMNFPIEKEELSFYSKISNGSVGDAVYFINNNTLSFYKNLCTYFMNFENFDEIDTSKIINSVMEKKNNLVFAFFKFINLLFNKVIKKIFLNKSQIFIEEERLVIEKLSKLYTKSKIFSISAIIEAKYNNFINLNTDLHNTLYSLLMELHINIKK